MKRWSVLLPWRGGGSPAGYTGTATVGAADSPYNVADSDQLIYVDATAGNVQINLPANPADGRTLDFEKISLDANTLTINRNGKLITNAAANLVDQKGVRSTYRFVYDAESGSWWVTNPAGQSIVAEG